MPAHGIDAIEASCLLQVHTEQQTSPQDIVNVLAHFAEVCNWTEALFAVVAIFRRQTNIKFAVLAVPLCCSLTLLVCHCCHPSNPREGTCGLCVLLPSLHARSTHSQLLYSAAVPFDLL